MRVSGIFPLHVKLLNGIEIDTITMQLQLPEDKLAKATLLVNGMAKCREVLLWDLLSLNGLHSFAWLFVPSRRAFLRRFINLTVGISRLHHFVTLNCDARADIYAWQIFLLSFNGNSMFLEQKFLSLQTNNLYTDTSNDIGFAAVFFITTWVAGSWHNPFTSADITLLGLYPLVLATKLFGKFLANHCKLFMADNSGVVDIINKSTFNNRAIIKVLRKLVLACLKYNILFRSRHVPGNQNIIA